MQKKVLKNFLFLDNLVWIGCVKLFLLRRERLQSAVNVLTNSPKTLHNTKRDFVHLHFLHNNQ